MIRVYSKLTAPPHLLVSIFLKVINIVTGVWNLLLNNISHTCRERNASQAGASESSAPASSSGVSSDLSDLSDFCLQPTNDMDEEEQRALQEDQDAVSLPVRFTVNRCMLCSLPFIREFCYACL